ncbi:hypothetical protein BBUWI9123_J0036 (plasmid) [Borreliella burgdorferi WI91-23]|nr:hypothetical protein BBUWI9123_J0036 [Borreliella burgdorferi WI91-23]
MMNKKTFGICADSILMIFCKHYTRIKNQKISKLILLRNMNKSLK